MANLPNELPMVLFRLKNQIYGISSEFVREIVMIPHVTPVMQTPDYLRGVINIRGKIHPVLDFRRLLGIKSSIQENDELIDLLEKRKQDHKNWLKELEDSIHEKREFKLTTDPHKCAFGTWYDSYHTENHIIESCLKKFDIPHKRIHAIADDVLAHASSGRYDLAFRTIEKTRKNELSEMIRLFDELCKDILDQHRELALITEKGPFVFAIAVDSIVAIEKMMANELVENGFDNQTGNGCFISGFGKRTAGNQIVQFINTDHVINSIF